MREVCWEEGSVLRGGRCARREVCQEEGVPKEVRCMYEVDGFFICVAQVGTMQTVVAR